MQGAHVTSWAGFLSAWPRSWLNETESDGQGWCDCKSCNRTLVSGKAMMCSLGSLVACGSCVGSNYPSDFCSGVVSSGLERVVLELAVSSQ